MQTFQNVATPPPPQWTHENVWRLIKRFMSANSLGLLSKDSTLNYVTRATGTLCNGRQQDNYYVTTPLGPESTEYGFDSMTIAVQIGIEIDQLTKVKGGSTQTLAKHAKLDKIVGKAVARISGKTFQLFVS
jgi:hypothetical protein